ncbi:MAG TPA: S8 family serine peptidase, partial [Thermoleophilaceae bacterium]
MYRGLACVLLLLMLPATPAVAAFPEGPPNDPLYDASPLPNATAEQWDLSSPALGFDRGISVDRAWPLTLGEGVTIAEIDAGVDYGHPDLAGRWAPGGYDFYARDPDPTSDTQVSHGTNVAGVLGATADNGLGIAGIAPRSPILPIRTSDNIIHQGARIAEAIVYATDRGARAISMSLGADSFPGSLRRAVSYAHRHGVVMAVASGNEFHFHHHQPQVLDGVLAVGGVNPDSANLSARDQTLAQAASDFTTRASYSNYGAHLDV